MIRKKSIDLKINELLRVKHLHKNEIKKQLLNRDQRKKKNISID